MFLAVMTESSSESEYVRAEIGARWMTRRYAVMLVAGSSTRSDMRGPLADTHALKLRSEPDLWKLIDEVAERLGVEPESQDSLHRLVKELATLAAATQRPRAATQPPQPRPALELSSELAQVLQVFVERDNEPARCPRRPRDGLRVRLVKAPA